MKGLLSSESHARKNFACGKSYYEGELSNAINDTITFQYPTCESRMIGPYNTDKYFRLNVTFNEL